jgi:hypothetical protein
MSIVLHALLPKIHLNRNTARSIIFGPANLGGLGLPHLYNYQGFVKISLFLGHIQLQDKTGKLLLVSLSHLQLFVGIGQLVLNASFRKYSSYIDNGWLKLLWEFASHAEITFHSNLVWVPPLTRKNDSYIMEQFANYAKNAPVMSTLNQCKLFLQVITMADISSACGSIILLEVKGGTPHNRKSTLRWPRQGLPSTSDWTLWSTYLGYLELDRILQQPLGPWSALSHQELILALCPISETLYKRSEEHWLFTRSIQSTRQLQVARYHTTHFLCSDPPP